MKFIAFERSKHGTGASRRLRITGRTPGIIYGGSAEPQLIEVDHNALWHALKKEAFHSSILTMEMGGAESNVLLRDVQVHPFKQQILHIDFQRVDASTKLHMKVPLHFVGDDQSPAVKTEGCIANHVINEIEVLCLPVDLPEFIKVDLSGMRKGTSLHLAEIPLPKGVKAVTRGSNKNPVVVSVVVVAAADAPAADAVVDGAEAAKPAGKAGAKPAAKPAKK
ncbi:MAG: 50S ribosomal protein L25/general stress protein Ctc [Rhodoferax sp.]|uniref:50S ribosomal protein L25/general stress protein Ctc n=1 Tax=Rhodoferax sp. TaxID=50421 RepID=UPI001B66600F|nr:50S ribosomal protein L25/general stress protein Ctc [Rhodoferax sp.]MBP9904077.1 50S ribosomal protein L25/general stress protein Ctc [Rhodoferax sp.]